MYCTECGQAVSEDRFGQAIHDYQVHDMHTPTTRDALDCE